MERYASFNICYYDKKFLVFLLKSTYKTVKQSLEQGKVVGLQYIASISIVMASMVLM